jgi:Ca2+-binding EF-hand superfamily protein
MNWRGLVAICFCSCIALSASAAEPWRMTDADSLFASFDKNRDGKLAATEIPAAKRRVFEHLLRTADKNKDGILTKQELMAVLDADAARLGPVKTKVEPQRANPQFIIRRFDTNKDKKLELSEVPPAIREKFIEILKVADKNKDNALDGPEIIAAAPLLAKLGKGKKEKPVKKPKTPAKLDDELFRLADTDGDGMLSVSEMLVVEEVLKEMGSEKDAQKKSP